MSKAKIRNDVARTFERAAAVLADAEVAATPQPPPRPNGHPSCWALVMDDFRARDEFGRRKYGTPLQPHNGRDALADAFQEALDLAVYLRQAIYERDGR
jgi:hypothetical protein